MKLLLTFLLMSLPLNLVAEETKDSSEARARLKSSCESKSSSLAVANDKFSDCMQKTGGKPIVTDKVCKEFKETRDALEDEIEKCNLKKELLF
jgi:hypothetical protein